MRRLAIAIAAALFAFPAVALTVSGVDMDGDNLISFAEMMVLYPDLTEEAFLTSTQAMMNSSTETNLPPHSSPV